ncbi:transcriptional regulator [Clostridium sp. ASBs410]|nr:transcriptional regulator [Clostridium sp. ASBs410]
MIEEKRARRNAMKGFGMTMVTMEEVAKAAHVSRATVSRVLSNHPSITMETRSNVMYWVRKLGYEPNQVAQSLAGNRTNLIGVLFSDLSNPLYASLMTSIVHGAEIYGYNVILGDAQREKAREASIINGFKRRKVDGIIVRPIGTPNKKLYSGIGIPMVSLFKRTEKKNIIISSEEGGIQVARHFCELGHINIGYIGPMRSLAGNNKLEGFRSELEKNGLKLKAVLECNQHETVENQRVYEIISQYFKDHDPEKVTAWFAHSDIAASDVIKALTEYGLKVPKDVIVCGYNNTLLARKMIPTLSSVASPIEEIAKSAVGMLLNGINGNMEEELIQLSPRLIIRESTSRELVQSAQIEI